MEAVADLLPFKKEVSGERGVSGLVSNHLFPFERRTGKENAHAVMRPWSFVLMYLFPFFPYVAFFDGWHGILMNLKLKYPLFSLM